MQENKLKVLIKLQPKRWDFVPPQNGQLEENIMVILMNKEQKLESRLWKMELPMQQSVTPLRVVSRSQTNLRASRLSMFLLQAPVGA